MTVEELIIYGKKYLHKHEVNMLLSNILNLDNLELLNYLDKVVDTTITEMIEGDIEEDEVEEFLRWNFSNLSEDEIEILLGAIY